MKTRVPLTAPAWSLLVTICLFFHNATQAQSLMFGNEKTRIEVGLNFGPSFFLGDLGGHHGKGTTFLKDLNLPFTKLWKGAYAVAYPNEWLGFRVAIGTGEVEGADDAITTKGRDELWRRQRNLDFRSKLSEAYAAFEIYPTMLIHAGDDDYKPRLRPYGVLGVGVFHFNPQGSLTVNGVTTWYDLQPLHTEGEGFPEYPDRKNYALTQLNIPMGFGAKYYLSDRVNLSLEVLHRKTFTDYIDDVSTTYIDPNLFDKYLSPANAQIARAIYDKVSGIYVSGSSRFAAGDQRGDPNQKDAYFSLLLKFAVRLGPIFDNLYDRRVASHMRCPARF